MCLFCSLSKTKKKQKNEITNKKKRAQKAYPLTQGSMRRMIRQMSMGQNKMPQCMLFKNTKQTHKKKPHSNTNAQKNESKKKTKKEIKKNKMNSNFAFVPNYTSINSNLAK